MMDGTNAVTVGQIVALPVQLAVIEVIELLTVLLAQRVPNSQKDCGIKVKICVPESDDAPINRWFHIEVQCVGISELSVQIKDFMKEHGSCLCRLLSEMEKLLQGPNLSIKLPKASGKESKSIQVRVLAEGKSAALISVVEEDLNQERHSVAFNFKVFQDFQRMLEECQGVYSYMHRSKITNPEYELEFHLNIGGTKSKSDFCSGGSKSHFGAKKIATDIRHFTQNPSDHGVMKVKPKSGTSSLLPPVHVCENKPDTTLRLSSHAFFVPPPEADVRSLSQMCTDLKVFLYGPCNVPLILPGVGTGISPTSLIKLSDYGLLLTGAAKTNTNAEKADVQADWHFKVQPTEAAASSEEQSTDDDQPELCLCVIIMLDTVQADQEGQKSLYILDGLRQNIAQVLCKLRARIRKCTSSALNKLLHNFTKQDQKQEVYTASVSTITKSLTSILKRSTNESFRNSCFSAMKVDDSSQFHDAVRNSLWQIASDRCGVADPTPKPSNTQESSCDAFVEVQLQVLDQTATQSNTASDPLEKPSSQLPVAPPLDFFDILTCHRSPICSSSMAKQTSETPLAFDSVVQIADTKAVKQSSQKQSSQRTLALECAAQGTVLKTSQHALTLGDASWEWDTERQTESVLPLEDVLNSGILDEACEETRGCEPVSPVAKKRKQDTVLQPDFFNALEFNGFSPDIGKNCRESGVSASMKPPHIDTPVSIVEEPLVQPAASCLSATEDWFNDILFE